MRGGAGEDEDGDEEESGGEKEGPKIGDDGDESWG